MYQIRSIHLLKINIQEKSADPVLPVSAKLPVLPEFSKHGEV